MKISLPRMVACVKKHEQVKEGICSSEARGQFAGIMNRQIYHKWFTVAQNISSKHFYTCFFITTACHHYVESYLKFLLLLLNKLSFSDTTVIEGGRERKHSWDLKSFILGDTLQLITPLPRTGMFSKIWRAILVEVEGPKAPHWMILHTSHLLWTIIYFYKTPPSKGPVLYLIGEMKSSSSSSNYPFTNLKSFNRTPKR